MKKLYKITPSIPTLLAMLATTFVICLLGGMAFYMTNTALRYAPVAVIVMAVAAIPQCFLGVIAVVRANDKKYLKAQYTEN